MTPLSLLFSKRFTNIICRDEHIFNALKKSLLCKLRCQVISRLKSWQRRNVLWNKGRNLALSLSSLCGRRARPVTVMSLSVCRISFLSIFFLFSFHLQTFIYNRVLYHFPGWSFAKRFAQFVVQDKKYVFYCQYWLFQQCLLVVKLDIILSRILALWLLKTSTFVRVGDIVNHVSDTSFLLWNVG